jgi:general secretion pathway protein I
VRHAAHQRGFTLIEVLVAFAVFALCVGALYESFAMAMKRSEQTTRRALALATAQSLLSQLRVQPPPWPSDQSGLSFVGQRWRIQVKPYLTDARSLEHPALWRAYRVAVTVALDRSASRAVELDSIEMARNPQ